MLGRFLELDLDCFVALHVCGLIISFMDLPMNAFVLFFISFVDEKCLIFLPLYVGS